MPEATASRLGIEAATFRGAYELQLREEPIALLDRVSTLRQDP